MVLMPIDKMELEEIDNLPDSLRGKGGFGSTGK
jgi:dUTP pyrophosphatase